MSPSWRVASTDAVLARAAPDLDPLTLLSATERARHDRFVQPVDREDFVAARLLARVAVLRHQDEPITTDALRLIEFVQRCETCGGPHGRPIVRGRDDLQVSWAHAKGVVAAAISPWRVGVDVERMAPEPPPGMSGDGSAPWLVWARAEAVTKAGIADLETALSWVAWLDGPAVGGGRQVALPDGQTTRLADGVDEQRGVVWAVAWNEPS